MLCGLQQVAARTRHAGPDGAHWAADCKRGLVVGQPDELCEHEGFSAVSIKYVEEIVGEFGRGFAAHGRVLDDPVDQSALSLPTPYMVGAHMAGDRQQPDLYRGVTAIARHRSKRA